MRARVVGILQTNHPKPHRQVTIEFVDGEPWANRISVPEDAIGLPHVMLDDEFDVDLFKHQPPRLLSDPAPQQRAHPGGIGGSPVTREGK